MTTNKQLRELAEKATQGDWTTDGGVTVIAAGSDQLNNGYAISECHGPESPQNADFIAAISPATVLALLDACEALQAECEKLRRRARAAEREYSKVARTLKDLERVAKVVSDNSDAVCGENNQLQAELEHLRKDADRIDWLADPSNSIGNVQLPIAVVRQHLHSLRDAIDAAMQEPTK